MNILNCLPEEVREETWYKTNALLQVKPQVKLENKHLAVADNNGMATYQNNRKRKNMWISKSFI